MARTDIELRVKADTRELQKVGDANARAFDASSAKKLDSAVSGLDRKLDSASKSAEALSTEIKSADKASDAYSNAAAKLTKLRSDADSARREISRLNEELRRAGAGAGAGGPGPARHPGGAGGGGGTPGGGGLSLDGLLTGGMTAMGFGAGSVMGAGIAYAVGSMISKAAAGPLRAAMGKYGTYQAQMRAQVGAAPFMARGGNFGEITGAGRAFGYMPGEATGMVGTLGRAAGTGVTTAMARRAFAMERAFGVGGSEFGRYMKGATLGTRGKGPNQSIEDAVASAIYAGFKTQEIPDYLSKITSLLDQQLTMGTTANLGAVNAMTAVLGEALGGGRRAARGAANVATGLQTAAGRVGTSGVSSALDMVLMRAAGYKGGGGDAYFEAMLNLQQGLSGGQMVEALGNLISPNASRASNTVIMQRALKQWGIPMLAGGAGKVVDLLGTEGGRSQLSSMVETAQAAQGGKKRVEQLGLARMGAGEGVLQTEAGFAAGDIAIGRDVAGTAQAIHKMGQNFAKVGGELIGMIEPLVEATANLSENLPKMVDATKKIIGKTGSEISSQGPIEGALTDAAVRGGLSFVPGGPVYTVIYTALVDALRVSGHVGSQP